MLWWGDLKGSHYDGVGDLNATLSRSIVTPVVMRRERRKQLDDPLTAYYEVKKLKGILGSVGAVEI